MWIHGAQLATARKAGLEPQECSYRDSLSYEKRAVRAERIFLMRHEPSPRISGWHLGEYGAKVAPASPDELAVAYTYQFARLRPAVMKLLLLPTGTGAIITGDEVTEVIGPDQKVRIQGPSA